MCVHTCQHTCVREAGVRDALGLWEYEVHRDADGAGLARRQRALHRQASASPDPLCVCVSVCAQTTTINCLTGALPPTYGDALIYGQSIRSTGGMDKIRSLMGVCPQFDVSETVCTDTDTHTHTHTSSVALSACLPWSCTVLSPLAIALHTQTHTHTQRFFCRPYFTP